MSRGHTSHRPVALDPIRLVALTRVAIRHPVFGVGSERIAVNVMSELLFVANLLTLLANLGVLGMTLKLYTEILKDKKFDHRAEATGHNGGRHV
jgi:hypothetical protein